MNNIRVTVDYELPNTGKFDALVEQYLQAKTIADTTEMTMIPLIQKGGKAKYDAICDQLSIIENQLKKIVLITNCQLATATGWYMNEYYDNYVVVIEYDGLKDRTKVYYGRNLSNYKCDFLDWDSNKDELLSSNGLITRWNDFKIIEDMQKDCNRQLNDLIEAQRRKAKRIVDTLSKIRE